jgi:hypothetical protein
MMTSKIESRQRSRVNADLFTLCSTYHDGLPIGQLDEILKLHGFNEMEPGIYCGREGRVNERVGERSFLSFSWYKMEVTGRYEVVAYVS